MKSIFSTPALFADTHSAITRMSRALQSKEEARKAKAQKIVAELKVRKASKQGENIMPYTRIVISQQSWGWVAIDTYNQERISQRGGHLGFAEVALFTLAWCALQEIDGFTVELIPAEGRSRPLRKEGDATSNMDNVE